MAEGAWIPVFDSIWTHRKTARLARELKVPIEVAAAKFLRLCAWARDACDSGDVGTVDHAVLAKAVGLPERFGGRLYSALQVAELISNDARGHVVGWEEGPGRLVDRRRNERERKAVWRAEEARKKRERQVNEERMEADRQAADLARTRKLQKTADALASVQDPPGSVHIGESPPVVPWDVPGDVRSQKTTSRREETYRSGRGSLRLAGDEIRPACQRASCGHPWFAHRGPGDPLFDGLRECTGAGCVCPDYLERSATAPHAPAVGQQAEPEIPDEAPVARATEPEPSR